LNVSGALGCTTLALSATDVDRFLIQHSIDGHDWTLVGEVKAGAFQSTYSMDDPKAQTRDNYYRLQQVDRDG